MAGQLGGGGVGMNSLWKNQNFYFNDSQLPVIIFCRRTKKCYMNDYNSKL